MQTGSLRTRALISARRSLMIYDGGLNKRYRGLRRMPESPKSESSSARPERQLSLDVFRGLVMCTLAINGFAVAATAKRLGYGPGVDVESWSGWIWQTLAFHNSHPGWDSQFYIVGCSFWDLIQPAFMFMVGVAMPYSYASRRARGDTDRKLAGHAFVRALVLVALGVFLQTRNIWFDNNRLFTNVLSQIGLGYFFVYLLLGKSARIQLACGVIVLLAYGIWLGTYPHPDPLPRKPLESIQTLSVPGDVANHYAILTNAPAQTDITILNLIPHDETIEPHAAGYATLNFIPSAVTMLIGVLAGALLRSARDEYQKLKWLIASGVACMAIAVLESYSVCPVIKKIWTPAWTLYSGAYVLWMLAGIFWFVDIKKHRGWTFPLVVVGMNSLAMYLMSMLSKRWISDRLENYFGGEIFSGPYGPTWQAVSVFAVLWLACLYLYRSRIFFRV